jgi:hypothetical protein
LVLDFEFRMYNFEFRLNILNFKMVVIITIDKKIK